MNLLQLISDQFSKDLVGKAAAYLGEPQDKITQGLGTIIPTTVAGMIKKAEDGDTSTLLTLAKNAFDSGILGGLNETFSSSGGGVPSIGPSLITGLFGDRFGSIANAVSSFTGLKGSSASSLFGTVVPLALGLIGKHAAQNNTTPGALASMLSSQKNDVMSMLPAGFDLSKLMGVKAAAAEPVKEKSFNWLLPLLGLLGIGALIWFFTRDSNKAAQEPVAIHDTVTKTNVVVIDREPVKLTLPNGVVIDAVRGSIEDLLIAFIQDSTAKAGNDNWFDFNDLNFKFGTAEIEPGSRKEVDNIVQILKAFPNVKVKLGGYTDKVGDEAANKKLSGERAEAVANALKTEGLGSQVVGAEGYGSEFAKYPSSAPEADRVKDRRVSLSVRAK